VLLLSAMIRPAWEGGEKPGGNAMHDAPNSYARDPGSRSAAAR
jgi:hypothetical protein